MASLSNSVKRVKTVLDSIGAAIEAKGVKIPAGTKAGAYPALIGQIANGIIDSQENYAYMFSNNNRLDIIMQGKINTSHVKNFSHMAYYSDALTQVKNLDLSSAESADWMFYNCTRLTYLNDGVLNMPKVTNTERMFYDCAYLKNLKKIVMSSAVKFYYTFGYALVDTDLTAELAPVVNSTDFMFYGSKIKSLTIASDTVIKTSRCMFGSCYSIKTIKGLNISGATLSDSYDGVVDCCYELENIEFAGEIKNFNINFSTCSKLTHASLLNILNALCENGSAKCTLGSKNLAKLTEEEKAIATNKGWQLA